LYEDLNYHRSTRHGVAPPLPHALTSAVVTRNTKNGKRTPAAGRLAGHAAAGAFTQGVLAAGSGASTAGIGLAAEGGRQCGARVRAAPQSSSPHVEVIMK
jgi:hypothetical protein